MNNFYIVALIFCGTIIVFYMTIMTKLKKKLEEKTSECEYEKSMKDKYEAWYVIQNSNAFILENEMKIMAGELAKLKLENERLKECT